VEKGKVLLSLVIGIVVLLAVLGLSVYFWNVDSSTSDWQEPSLQTNESTNSVPATNIGEAWNWQEVANTSEQTLATKETPSQLPQATNLPFTAQSVYDALQAVKIDAQGNIILDHDAMLALDEALEPIFQLLNPQSLALLQELILKALPNITGEQVAELVADYYEYLVAKDEFSRLRENSDRVIEPNLQSVRNDEVLYEDLQALRDVHLGSEATEQLFRVTDASAKLMFDSMKLSFDEQLSPEERTAKQQALQDTLIRDSLNIDNWDARYNAFQNEKSAIVNADISDANKQLQFRQLLSQHFSSEEQEKMAYFDLTRI
jgi:lipase chaperone LimK